MRSIGICITSTILLILIVNRGDAAQTNSTALQHKKSSTPLKDTMLIIQRNNRAYDTIWLHEFNRMVISRSHDVARKRHNKHGKTLPMNDSAILQSQREIEEIQRELERIQREIEEAQREIVRDMDVVHRELEKKLREIQDAEKELLRIQRDIEQDKLSLNELRQQHETLRYEQGQVDSQEDYHQQQNRPEDNGLDNLDHQNLDNNLRKPTIPRWRWQSRLSRPSPPRLGTQESKHNLTEKMQRMHRSLQFLRELYKQMPKDTLTNRNYRDLPPDHHLDHYIRKIEESINTINKLLQESIKTTNNILEESIKTANKILEEYTMILKELHMYLKEISEELSSTKP